MSNLTIGGEGGNDAAVDNIAIYDATPQVEPSFAPGSVPGNGTSVLRLTVVNSTDLANKPGWSFIDTLPAGLVAVDPAAGTGGTCPATAAIAGNGRTISVTGGNLKSNVASCTITVPVKPSSPPTRTNPTTQTYTNCGTDVTAPIGVDPVGCGSVSFYFTDLRITKTATPASPGLGDVVIYTVTATNVGNGAYTAAYPATIVDDLSGVLDDATYTGGASFNRAGTTSLAAPRFSWVGALPQGASVRLTFSVTVKPSLEAPADAILRNVAFAPDKLDAPAPECSTLNPPGIDAATGFPCAVGVARVAALTLVKQVAPTSASLNDVVDYTFTVTNAGADAVTGISISDPLLGQITFAGLPPGAPASLPAGPGSSTTAIGSYMLSQADVDAGGVHNTAAVNGTTAAGVAVSSTHSAYVTAPQSPSITLTKIADLPGPANPAVGDPILFHFVITNTGDVTLTGVAITDIVITDPKLGGAPLDYVWPDPAAPGVLAPNGFATATGSYYVTQQDILAGIARNTATVDASTLRGAPLRAVSNVATVALGQNAALQVTKEHVIDGGGEPALGSEVTYRFTVTNTGNLPVSALGITDSLLEGDVAFGTWPGAVGILAPTESVIAEGHYAISQDDVDAGQILNIAQVTGTATVGGTPTSVSATSNTDVVAIGAAPSITISKEAELGPGADNPVRTGNPITYHFTVTNTGNITLENVTITDNLLDSATIAFDWPDVPGELRPGTTAQVTATGTLTLTQPQVNAGSLRNEATANAVTRVTNEPVISSVADATVVWDLSPAISMTGSTTIDAADPVIAGTPTRFVYEITNTGTVTLTGVSLTDQAPCVPGTLTYLDWPGPVGVLDPGQIVHAQVDCTLTQTEIDVGTISKLASVAGIPPVGDPVEASAEPAADIAQQAQNELSKVGQLRILSGVAAVPGDLVLWQVILTNTGNVTLDPAEITDDFPGVSEQNYGEWPDSIGVLPPGTSVTLFARTVLTQADIDAGVAHNEATSTAAPPASDDLAAAIAAEVDLPEGPAITLTVSAALAPGATGAVRDRVVFSYVAANVGNVALTEVSIADPMDGLSPLRYTWPTVTGELAPGASVTATADYTITSTDVTNGYVADPATATGTSPQGTVVTATADTRLPLRPLPATGFDPMQEAVLSVLFVLAGLAFYQAASRSRLRRQNNFY